MIESRSLTTSAPQRADVLPVLGAVVAILVTVEIASGALQGYYGPVLVDIAAERSITYGDLNWLEAAQLAVAALVVPPLARLGDLIGHGRVLFVVTLVTAAASWGIAFAPNFWLLLVAWAVQGCYVVWLPVEVAMIHRRSRTTAAGARTTRRVAALLVATLELSVIAFAIVAGQLVDRVPLSVTLAVPAVAVTACLPFVWWLRERGDPERAEVNRKDGFDWAGSCLLCLVIVTVMTGLILIRLQGLSSFLAWGALVAGCALVASWWRWESRHPDPLIDVRLLSGPAQWGVQLTSFLLGVTLLGAQVPLTTYFRSDPDQWGFGFGLTAAEGALRLTAYVGCLAVGALVLPALSRWLGARCAMVVSALVLALGYAAWLPFHASVSATWWVMAVIGLGTGGLVAALPVAAATAAPVDRIGSATGLTNASKTIGGAMASATFAICLTSTGTLGVDGGSLAGYYAVWTICSVTGVLAAVVLAWTVPGRVTDGPAGRARWRAR